MDYIVGALLTMFNWVLASSAMATVLAGLIFLVKFVFRNRLGVNWHYLIWLLLLIRLILPWAPASSFSIYNLFPLEKQGVVQTSGEVLQDKDPAVSRFSESGGVITQGKDNNQATATGGLPGVDQSVAYQDTFPVTSKLLFGTWLLGIVTVAFYTVLANRRFAKKIRGQSLVAEQMLIQAFANSKDIMGFKAKIPLLETSGIQSPTLYGLIRPRLLLPEGVSETLSLEQLNHVFLHELAHYIRRDITVNWLMSVLLILHWFNPLLWYAFYRMREDQEIACDAFALSRLNPGEAKEYAHTIIKLLDGMAQTPRLASLASVSGTTSLIIRRITMIKLFKKNTLKWSLLGMGVLVLISGMALTNARVDASTASAPPVFGRTIAEALDKGGRNVSLILAQEKTTRGVLVFYLPRIGGDRAGVQSELGVEYLQQTMRGWKMSFQGGMYSSGIEQKVYYEFLPDDGDHVTPLPLFYGEVKDPGIKYISVIDVQKGDEKQAKVIVAGQQPGLSRDMRIWYAALGQPDGDTYEIRGKDDNGQVLFAETVNVKQGSFSGTVPRAEVNASPWRTYTSAAYHLTLQYPASTITPTGYH